MFRRNALLLFGLTSLLTAGSAWAASPSPGSQVIPFDGGTEARVHHTGAIRLKSDQTFQWNDQIYRVSLSFTSEADWAKAKSLGFHSVDLRQLDRHVFANERGETTVRENPGVSLLETGAAAKRTLCSDSVARGVKELAPDLWVAVDIHAGFARLPDPGNQDWNDGFRDCSVIVLTTNGCGGAVCYNGYSSGDDFWIQAGKCVKDPALAGSAVIEFCHCG